MSTIIRIDGNDLKTIFRHWFPKRGAALTPCTASKSSLNTLQKQKNPMILDPTSTTICLVRPRIPENVGFAARSMTSFGFTQLILVDPAFSLKPESPAYKTASGAHEVLDRCQVFRHFEEAVEPFHQVLGFSRRLHCFERPQTDLGPWLKQHGHLFTSQRLALVFGPEDYGLSTAEKQLCKQIITIPMKAETMSLNLSHAVTVVLYEINQVLANASNLDQPKEEQPVTHRDVQRVVNQLISMLEPTSFFKAGRKEHQTEEIRNLIQRLELTEDEYNSVMGMLNALIQRKSKE